MTLVDELYCAMVEVSNCAKRDKLKLNLIDVAQRAVDLGRRDEKLLFRFASVVIALFATEFPNFRVATRQLPKDTANAYWRLMDLIKYIASFDGEQQT